MAALRQKYRARCAAARRRQRTTSPTVRTRSAWWRPFCPHEVDADRPDGAARPGFAVEHGLTVIGLRRGRTVHGHGLLNEKLRIGDTLLLVGFWTDIRRLHAEGGDMVVLNMPAELDEVLPAASRAPHALAVLALVVGLMVSGIVPNVQAALIGCLLMGLLGCVDLNSAYRLDQLEEPRPDRRDDAVLGRAATDRRRRSGGRRDGRPGRRRRAAPGAGDAVRHNGGAGPVHLEHRDGRADGARRAGHRQAIFSASPYPFAMIVALAASSAFMTPISSPVNTLVVGPGNYAFGDFVRVGVPFTLVVLVVSVLLVPWLLPLF